MAVHNRVCGPTQCGITALTPRCTKGGCKLDGGQRMPGAGLSCRRSRKAPLGKPTSSRTGENPRYGMIGRIEETSASFEARYAPRSYPTPISGCHAAATRPFKYLSWGFSGDPISGVMGNASLRPRAEGHFQMRRIGER